MDRYCRGCKYQGFEENDKNEIWGFCVSKEAEPRKVAAEWENYIHRDAIKFGYQKKKKTIEENKVPSCQLVQAGYNELYGKHCPYFEKEKVLNKEEVAKAIQEVIEAPSIAPGRDEAIARLRELGILDDDGNVTPAYKDILIARKEPFAGIAVIGYAKDAHRYIASHTDKEKYVLVSSTSDVLGRSFIGYVIVSEFNNRISHLVEEVANRIIRV